MIYDPINQLFDKLYNSHNLIVKVSDFEIININLGEFILNSIILLVLIIFSHLGFIIINKIAKEI